MSEQDDLAEQTKRKKRREELESRIGGTSAGYDWLRRVNQIGKDGPALRDSGDVRKEGKGGEDTSSS